MSEASEKSCKDAYVRRSNNVKNEPNFPALEDCLSLLSNKPNFNLCDPFKQSNTTEYDRCSMECIDSEFNNRIQLYYTNDTVSENCPPFWETRRIKINPVDFKSEEYMNNIQTAAYIGMSLNVAMVILFLATFKGKFKKLYKAYYTSTSWKCITFTACFQRWYFVTFPFFESLSPLADSILDAVYFGKLETDNDTLVHIDSKIIQAMAAFVFISVLKDFLIGFYLHWTYEDPKKVSPKMDYPKFRAAELITSFLLEDCAQVALQYFWFEKYRFRADWIIYLNAGVLILRGIILVIIVINYCVQKWNNLARMEKSFYIFGTTMVFFALAYPISRMAGAIFQIKNEIPNSLKGACVRYNKETNSLIADPFRDWDVSDGSIWKFGATGTCWNAVDLIVFLSSVIILGILAFLFISCCFTVLFVCTYQSRKAKKATELRERDNREADARAQARAKERAEERARAHLNRNTSHLSIDESIRSMYRKQSYTNVQT